MRKSSRSGRRTSSLYEEGERYYERHRDELLRDYEGQWVALTADGVIDSGTEYSPLTERVISRVGHQSIFMPKIERSPRVIQMRSPMRVVRD